MASEQCCKLCLKNETRNEPQINSLGFQIAKCTSTKVSVLYWSTQNVEYATKGIIKPASHLSLNLKASLLSRTGHVHYAPLLTVHYYPLWVPEGLEWRIALITNRINREPWIMVTRLVQ